MISRAVLRGSRAQLRVARQQRRGLTIHEYQSKDLFQQYGVPVPRGTLAASPEEVEAAVNSLGGRAVLKPQILAGGREAGTFDSGLKKGIFIVNPSEGKSISAQMFGQRLTTVDTPSTGLQVSKVLVSEPADGSILKFLALTIDRQNFCPTFVVSLTGGIQFESQKEADLSYFPVVYSQGPTAAITAQIAEKLDTTAEALTPVLQGLYKIFKEKDAVHLEVNPLLSTPSGGLLVDSATLHFDNDAIKRQSAIFSLRDLTQEIPEELEAEKFGVIYVRLEGDGDIGNIVNGAGLAMATNDAVAMYGGQSANFLDAGGQATTETMVNAFRIVLGDERVKTIIVNIYGGIIRCDMIAESVIEAAARLDMGHIPVVVRLQGTNAALGQKMIAESGLALYAEDEFGSAAKKAVELATEAKMRK